MHGMFDKRFTNSFSIYLNCFNLLMFMLYIIRPQIQLPINVIYIECNVPKVHAGGAHAKGIIEN